MHLCLLLTRSKHVQLQPKPKPNQYEHFQQTLINIQNGVEIKDEDLSLFLDMINMMNWERARKHTVYWYSRQG